MENLKYYMHVLLNWNIVWSRAEKTTKCERLDIFILILQNTTWLTHWLQNKQPPLYFTVNENITAKLKFFLQ
jgi:hypothetical protein